MTTFATDIVMQSYGRCCASPGFFDDFYQQFLASSDEVASKFSNTDLPAQKLLLRQGILNLVLYARGLPSTKLQALAVTHAKGKLDIAPHLYDHWLSALLLTIRRHDPDADDTTLRAWSDVLSPGIALIRAGYNG